MAVLRWFKYVLIATVQTLLALTVVVGSLILTGLLISYGYWWVFPLPLFALLYVSERAAFLFGYWGMSNEILGTPKYPIGITHSITSLVLVILLISFAVETELFSLLADSVRGLFPPSTSQTAP